MTSKTFAIHGDICWSKTQQEFACVEGGYLVIEDGVVSGVFEKLPERYQGIELIERAGKLVVPGFSDIHVHAPQYAFRGLGMDLELLDWLNTHTFPEEAKYQELVYANSAYDMFTSDLKASPTTRAVVFGTLHTDATVSLMDKLEASGLKTLVGKVNMDRNSPDYLCEGSPEQALANTRSWLSRVAEKNYANTQPILTPRFTPSCTDELMRSLGELKQEFDLPLQSHLSENLSEIDWVKSLCPWSSCYLNTYERCGELDGKGNVVMAHCNYCPDNEVEILRNKNVWVAHCPQSNTMLSSGIAPIRHYLDLGMHVGLGTDVAGGATLSMFRAISDAVAVSKLRWRLVDQNLSPLSTQEAFWLATVGGGSFFGKVGSFEPGFEADVLVLDDSNIKTPLELSLAERLERYVYLAAEGGKISDKFVAGVKVF